MLDSQGVDIVDYWRHRSQGWTLDQLGNQGEVVDFNDPSESTPVNWYEGTFNDANEYSSRKVRADLNNPAQMRDDFSAVNFTVPGVPFDSASISGGSLAFTSINQNPGEDSARAIMVSDGGPIGPAMYKVTLNLPSTLAGEAGIVFGYLGFGDYYMATVDLATGVVSIKQVSSGVTSTAASGTLPAGTLVAGQSYELVLVTDRRSINVADGLVVSAVPSAVPGGYCGLVSTSSSIGFDDFTVYNSAVQTDVLGRWAFRQSRGYSDGLLIGTVDESANPDVFDSNAQAMALLKTLRTDNFEIVFKASLCGGSTSDDFSFIFGHDGAATYNSLKFNLATSSPTAPTLWQVTEGGTPGNKAATNSASLPAATNSYLWIRIVCSGSENGLVVQARASDLDPWSDVFRLMFFTSEGHTGFAGGPVLIDDLTVKYYINSNWTEACVEDFDVTSGYRELEPLHDANGNLTYDGSYVYTYDGWNRLKTVSLALPDDTLSPSDADSDPDSGPTIANIEYDGLGRRTVKEITNSGDWNNEYNYYYDGWKVAEIRNGDEVCSQYVWGLNYIDELCMVRWQFDAGAVRQVRDYYALQDANYNVMGVVDSEGILIERYEYTPYGQRTAYSHQHLMLSA